MGANLNIVFKLIKLYLAAGVPGRHLEQLNDMTEDKKTMGFQAVLIRNILSHSLLKPTSVC